MKKPITLLVILLLSFSTFGQMRQPQAESPLSEQLLTETDTSQNDGLIVPDLIEPNASEIFPARGGEVDWGLALSGGGIRSGFYSIGALKALYDKGLLDKIDVISSVSGGGYASYWLMTHYKKYGQNSKFGDSALTDREFVQNICHLQDKKKASFVPTVSLLEIIFNFRGKAFRKYKRAIENTFGNLEGKTPPDETPLDFLNERIESRDVPYFIFNTTLRVKKDLQKDPSYRLFEITPYFRGNRALEFRSWADWKGNKPLTLSESVAASAAPKWKIAHRVESFIPNNLNFKKFYLSDGGHFENLAALSLIRRGVKNIIIVDAEEDATYEFGAYTALKDHLKKLKIDLNIEKIEVFLKDSKNCKSQNCDLKKVYPKSVSTGRAVSTDPNVAKSIDSKIYYIKMSQAKSIFPEKLIISEQEKTNEAYIRGEKLNRRRKAEFESKGCENITVDLEQNKNFYSDLYTYRVLRYADEINNPRKKNLFLWSKMQFFKILSRAHPFLTYQFPHITTVDQSFFSDQAEAFVGLGYLQTSEIKQTSFNEVE